MKPDATKEGSLRFAVGDRGQRFLATRELGRARRTQLEAELDRASLAKVLIIDFSDVEAMTISFADEFLGRFYATRATASDADRLIRLDRLNDDTEETVGVCLERRDQIAVVQRAQGVGLLAAPIHLVETYESARALGEFSALDLAAALGVTPQNINNRLRRLVAAGALLRWRTPSDHGGKEFSYRTEPVAVSGETRSHTAAGSSATLRSGPARQRSMRQRNPQPA